MKAKKKQLDTVKPEDLGVDVAPAPEDLKVAEPPSAAPASRCRRGHPGRQAQERSQGDLNMTALVIAEHDNASIKGATLNTVTAAKACGGDVHVLVAGDNAGAAALPPPRSPACQGHPRRRRQPQGRPGRERGRPGAGHRRQLQPHPVPRHRLGKNVAPRVAAKLDVAQISDITKVDSADTFERPIYAGNAIATVQSPTPSRSSPCAPPALTRRPPPAAAPPWKPWPPWPTAARAALWAAK
jgi:electron transfer flavoprotein alpha subunit